MIQPCVLASPPHPTVPPPAPASTALVWAQLPTERQEQALLILAQMLVRAQVPEAGHDQPE